MSSRSRELPKQPISKESLFAEFTKSSNASAHFCLSLHMVPEQLRACVLKEETQVSEWKNLFPAEFHPYDTKAGIDCSTQLAGGGGSGFLPVDTRLLNAQLTEQIRKSISAVEIDGILIHGDNAAFLKSTGELLSAQVRMVYMDPPYNTGNTHYGYKDSFERSDWLGMMRNLLIQSLPTLSSNGSICISIDDSEMPYLRVLLDEIVGEKNFVSCIAYERSGSAGLGQGAVILNTKEYILLYSLDKKSLNDIGHERPIDR